MQQEYSLETYNSTEKPMTINELIKEFEKCRDHYTGKNYPITYVLNSHSDWNNPNNKETKCVYSGCEIHTADDKLVLVFYINPVAEFKLEE